MGVAVEQSASMEVATRVMPEFQEDEAEVSIRVPGIFKSHV
jgi:hypothetical protein